jgi:hypothetical protein
MAIAPEKFILPETEGSLLTAITKGLKGLLIMLTVLKVRIVL